MGHAHPRRPVDNVTPSTGCSPPDNHCITIVPVVETFVLMSLFITSCQSSAATCHVCRYLTLSRDNMLIRIINLPNGADIFVVYNTLIVFQRLEEVR